MKMLYRKGNSESPKIHGLHCDTMTVDNGQDEQSAKSDGWHESPAEAHGQAHASTVADTDEGKALQDERDGLLQEVEQMKADHEALAKRFEAMSKDRDTLSAHIDDLNKERDELNAQIAELTKPADPAADKKTLTAKEKA